MEASQSYHLWQKPYGETMKNNILEKYQVVFCPFAHNAKDIGNLSFQDYIENQDFNGLRDYHHQLGYRYKTSTEAIKIYIEYFKSLEYGDIIYIPHRCFSKDAETDRGYRVKVLSKPFYDTIDGMDSLYRRIKILNDNVQIIPGVRVSMKKILF
jgi:hypothetical protein